MFVDIQLESGGFTLGDIVDDRGKAVKVRVLEQHANDDSRYSFKSPVWIDKDRVVYSYKENQTINNLGYEEVEYNVYREIDDPIDEDYVPPKDDDEDEESEDSLN